MEVKGDEGKTIFVPARLASRRIGDVLRHQKFPLDKLEAAELARSVGESLSGALIRLGYLDEGTLAAAYAKEYGVSILSLDAMAVPTEVVGLVPEALARRYNFVPVALEKKRLRVAVAEPSHINDIYSIMRFQFPDQFDEVDVSFVEITALNRALEKYYGPADGRLRPAPEPDGGGGAMPLVERHPDPPKIVGTAIDEVPLVREVNQILRDAVNARASDIHIEPYDGEFLLRFRIDGILRDVKALDVEHKSGIVNRLKIMAELDIAERRAPQDGRIRQNFGLNRVVDFRISFLPMIHGEKVVLRVLDHSLIQLDLRRLGLDQDQMEFFKTAIHEPWGMVLVTGPTGSGKSITLYSALREISTRAENISTVEDPVEMELPGINQVQIDDPAGLTFAAALRSLLRQDPDIVMVGEMRDFETAETAVKAALTGHLVFSTLHTNDAPSTIMRLLNMGVEPFLVSSSLLLICAQRLVRKVCQNCAEETTIDQAALLMAGFSEETLKTATFRKGRGCAQCNNSGYKGRVGVFEVMPIADPIREAILQGHSSDELRHLAKTLGMKTMRQSGLDKVAQGLTTVEEVLRLTRAN